jgi:hypothetical protein
MTRFTQLLCLHYQAFWPCLEQLRSVAEQVRAVPPPTLRHELDAVCAFLLQQLAPHTQIADQVLYPLVEYLLAAPCARLRGEQGDIRRLTAELLVLRARLNDEPCRPEQTQALHHVLQVLATRVTAHLTQEAVYLPLLAARLTAAADHGFLVVSETVMAEIKYDS